MMHHPLSQFKYCPKCGSKNFIENNFKSKKCQDCQFTYYFNSCGASVALILNSEKQLLVATRASDPAKGTFDLPGGFIDMYETAEEGVCREVKEETGLDVDKAEYLFSIPNIYVYSGFEVHTIDLFFICHVGNTKILKADDDVEKLQFIALNELKPELFGLKSIKEGIKKIVEQDLLK